MDGRSQSELVGRTAPRASGPIAAQRGISQKEATEELLAEKQPSLDFASPAQELFGGQLRLPRRDGSRRAYQQPGQIHPGCGAKAAST